MPPGKNTRRSRFARLRVLYADSGIASLSDRGAAFAALVFPTWAHMAGN
jgi:hypothetical protein